MISNTPTAPSPGTSLTAPLDHSSHRGFCLEHCLWQYGTGTIFQALGSFAAEYSLDEQEVEHEDVNRSL